MVNSMARDCKDNKRRKDLDHCVCECECACVMPAMCLISAAGEVRSGHKYPSKTQLSTLNWHNIRTTSVTLLLALSLCIILSVYFSPLKCVHHNMLAQKSSFICADWCDSARLWTTDHLICRMHRFSLGQGDKKWKVNDALGQIYV